MKLRPTYIIICLVLFLVTPAYANNYNKEATRALEIAGFSDYKVISVKVDTCFAWDYAYMRVIGILHKSLKDDKRCLFYFISPNVNRWETFKWTLYDLKCE